MFQVSSLVLALILTLSVQNVRTLESEWRNVLTDPIFSRFIDQLSYKGAPVDVGMSRSCITEHSGILDDVATFLKRLLSTSRLFTTKMGFCEVGKRFCDEPYAVFAKAVILFCGKRWIEVANTFIRQYSHHVTIFSDEFYENAQMYYHHLTISTGFEKGAYYNVTFRENQTLLTVGQETKCISCDSSALRAGEPLMQTKQVPLSGRELQVYCLRPYICEHPTFPLLLDALRHKGAILTTIPIDNSSESKRHLAEAFFMHSVSTIVHNPVPEVRNVVQVPQVVVPVYYDSFAYSVFVRRRHPLPKEVVIFLPFSWRVWMALMSTTLVCGATLRLLLQARRSWHLRDGAHFDGAGVIYVLVPLLLQQSCQLPAALRKRTTARLVVGLWALSAVVMSTGFRASLTSLLREAPLDGRPLEFTSERDVSQQGFISCRLTYAGDSISFSLRTFSPVRRKRDDCVSAEDKVQRLSATDVVYLLHSPGIGAHEGYVTQLYQNGYAPLPQKLSPYLTGPSIRSNSMYREAVAETIVQAFECGLFQRELELDQHAKRYKAAQNEQPIESGDQTLAFSDLKACLLIGAYGLGLATLFLLAEVAWKATYSCHHNLCK
ncbi:uncharacterized protein LOC144123300 [Amblyomma americanum]